MIIDNGRCENIASKMMAKNLNLNTMDHCKIEWIEKGSKTDEQCVVSSPLLKKF